jgi:putative SOS response-associated peptidase YedK
VPFARRYLDVDLHQRRRPKTARLVRRDRLITVDANGLVAPWHDKMRLVLEPENWALWLGNVAGDPAALLRPVADDVLMLRPIGSKARARR